jgi:hypothetical protein
MRRDTEWQCNHLVRGDHHAYKSPDLGPDGSFPTNPRFGQ